MMFRVFYFHLFSFQVTFGVVFATICRRRRSCGRQQASNAPIICTSSNSHRLIHLSLHLPFLALFASPLISFMVIHLSFLFSSFKPPHSLAHNTQFLSLARHTSIPVLSFAFSPKQIPLRHHHYHRQHMYVLLLKASRSVGACSRASGWIQLHLKRRTAFALQIKPNKMFLSNLSA